MTSNVKARIFGVTAVLAALVIAYFFGLQPLSAARAHSSEVSYNIKAFVLAPLLLVSGIFLLIGGARVLEAFDGPPRGREQHSIVWSMFIIGIVAGAGAFWWFNAQLDALGY